MGAVFTKCTAHIGSLSRWLRDRRPVSRPIAESHLEACWPGVLCYHQISAHRPWQPALKTYPRGWVRSHFRLLSIFALLWQPQGKVILHLLYVFSLPIEGFIVWAGDILIPVEMVYMYCSCPRRRTAWRKESSVRLKFYCWCTGFLTGQLREDWSYWVISEGNRKILEARSPLILSLSLKCSYDQKHKQFSL